MLLETKSFTIWFESEGRKRMYKLMSVVQVECSYCLNIHVTESTREFLEKNKIWFTSNNTFPCLQECSKLFRGTHSLTES